jgi:hypothetical protein
MYTHQTSAVNIASLVNFVLASELWQQAHHDWARAARRAVLYISRTLGCKTQFFTDVGNRGASAGGENPMYLGRGKSRSSNVADSIGVNHRFELGMVTATV